MDVHTDHRCCVVQRVAATTLASLTNTDSRSALLPIAEKKADELPLAFAALPIRRPAISSMLLPANRLLSGFASGPRPAIP
jgi:hypothetical protein